MRNWSRHLPKRQNYSCLITIDEKAKLEYRRDKSFQLFVNEWNLDKPETLTMTLTDFYKEYQKKWDATDTFLAVWHDIRI